MNKLEGAIREIDLLEEQAGERNRLNSLPALLKILLTIWYILLTVSFHKYDIFGLLSMGLYPLVQFLIYDIPFGRCLKRIRMILPFLLIAGMANPFFDKNVIAVAGDMEISGGMVSMLTLMMKGFFTVLWGYLLIVSTSIEKICGALKKLHAPSILITMILLIYRYIALLLKETDRVMQAYRLRAPGQKGVQIKAWGSFVGLLLLRSMDRAEDVYESMHLRGFDGSGSAFLYTAAQRIKAGEYAWFLLWMAAMLFFRLFPLFTAVGNLFMS